MCLYKDSCEGCVWPPEDLDFDRVKSLEGDQGEWRLVTVERCHVFGPDSDAGCAGCVVKGYGRVTVLAKYPSEVYYEFGFWNVPVDVDDDTEPYWDSRDVHWEHTWVAIDV